MLQAGFASRTARGQAFQAHGKECNAFWWTARMLMSALGLSATILWLYSFVHCFETARSALADRGTLCEVRHTHEGYLKGRMRDRATANGDSSHNCSCSSVLLPEPESSVWSWTSSADLKVLVSVGIGQALQSPRITQAVKVAIFEKDLQLVSQDKRGDDKNSGGSHAEDIAFSELRRLVPQLAEEPRFKSLGDVKLLNLSWATVRPVSDSDMAHVGLAKNLFDLQLGRTAVTDEGLGKLQGLAFLEGLGLAHTGVRVAKLIDVKSAIPEQDR
jgi:hypothetical protein